MRRLPHLSARCKRVDRKSNFNKFSFYRQLILSGSRQVFILVLRLKRLLSLDIKGFLRDRLLDSNFARALPIMTSPRFCSKGQFSIFPILISGNRASSPTSTSPPCSTLSKWATTNACGQTTEVSFRDDSRTCLTRISSRNYRMVH